MEKELAKCLEMINTIRNKVTNSGIELVSIGQYKYTIFIFLRNKEDIELIKNFLSEEELNKSIVTRA